MTAQAGPALRMTNTRALDRAEVESLIASQYPGLRLLILRRTRDPTLCNDLLQEAICTTWEKWEAGRIAKPELIAGYVFQVAMNLLRNHRRSFAERADKRAGDEVAGLVETPDSAPDAAAQERIAQQVRRFLAGLSDRDRFVIERFYLHERDKDSICREWGGLSPLQFDKVIHRARGRLRALFEGAGFEKGDFFMLCLA